MEIERTLTAVDIPAWEARLAAAMALPLPYADEWTGTVPSPYPGIGRERRRLHLTVDALKRGLSVRHVFDGLLLDGEIVLATNTNKWRFARNDGNWHRYASVGDVYVVVNGGLVHDPRGRVPEMPDIRSRFHGLLEAMGRTTDSHELPSDPEAAWNVVRKLGIEFERIKASDALPPTKPQMKTARLLVNALGIAMPELTTRGAATRFIDTHGASFTDALAGGPLTGQAAKASKVATGSLRRLPDYARLKRAQVPNAALLTLGVSSVDHLVARVNSLRALADRPYVTRPQFPSNLANFRSLAGELLGATRDPADTSVPGQGHVPDVWFVTAGIERLGNPRSYDPESPLIEFLIENLDLLPAMQRIAVDRRFYVSAPWKGIGPLAREMSTSMRDAETLLDAGFHAFGNVTGCWRSLKTAIMSSGPRAPVTLAEVEAQPWTAGMPDDAILMVTEKVTGLRHVHVKGHGDYLMLLTNAEIQRFLTEMRSAYPTLRWQQEADGLLAKFHGMFGGRIDDVVRHMLGYEEGDRDEDA